jgi:hypothetical protein
MATFCFGVFFIVNWSMVQSVQSQHPRLKNLSGGRRNNVVETKQGVLTNAWGKQKEVKDREILLRN